MCDGVSPMTGKRLMQAVARCGALSAAGFTGCRPYVAEQSGVARTARGTLATADGGYATAQAGVFAAGDARRGQSLVVWAIAEGRACAAAVDEYLEQIG